MDPPEKPTKKTPIGHQVDKYFQLLGPKLGDQTNYQKLQAPFNFNYSLEKLSNKQWPKWLTKQPSKFLENIIINWKINIK